MWKEQLGLTDRHLLSFGNIGLVRPDLSVLQEKPILDFSML